MGYWLEKLKVVTLSGSIYEIVTCFPLFDFGNVPARCGLPLLLTMNSKLTECYLNLVAIVQ